MIKRTFKAKICDDFKQRWLDAVAKDEGTDLYRAVVNYGGIDLDAFGARISGKTVLITENEYPQGSNDFFEVIDNNFVMYPELFEELK